MNKFYYEVFLDVHGNKTSIVKGLRDSGLARFIIGLKEDKFFIPPKKDGKSKITLQLCCFSEFPEDLFHTVDNFQHIADGCIVTLTNFRTRSLAPAIPVASFHEANQMVVRSLIPLFNWLGKHETIAQAKEVIKDDKKSD